MIEVFKLNDVQPNFRAQAFGRQIESLRKIVEFKESPKVKVVHLDQKGGKVGGATAKKAIREFIRGRKIKQYYAWVNASESYFDDSFKFYYEEEN